MASKVYYSPFIPTFNGNGLPVALARLYFFYTGTTNLAPIYADSAMTTPLANPVISDGAARYPNIYLNESITYRVRETGPDGTPLAADIDPYIPGQAAVVVPDLPEFADPTGATLVGYSPTPGGTATTVKTALDRLGPVFEGYGAGGADDTTELQTAITGFNVLDGGRLYALGDTYIINGAQQPGPGGVSTAQVLWPNRVQADGAATISIVGNAPAAAYDSTVGGLVVYDGGTIFLSNATTGSVFGGNGEILAGTYDETAVKACVGNCTVRVPDNPGTTAMNLYYCAWAELENFRADTGTATASITEPTHANGKGITMPRRGNGNQSMLKGTCSVSGFYDGVYGGEHDKYENLIAFGCKYAMAFTGSDFPVSGNLLYANCQNGLRFASAIQYIDLKVSIEHYDPGLGFMPVWMTPVYDIDDVGNLARGRVVFHSVKAGVGFDSSATAFVRRGGYYLTCRPLATAYVHTRVTRTVAQTIPDNVATAVAWDSTVQDFNFGAHNSAVNNSRFTPKQYGTYRFSAHVRFAANATGIRWAKLIKNIAGTDYTIDYVENRAPSGAVPTYLKLGTEWSADNPTDYFYVQVYQNSGGNLDIELPASPDFSTPVFIMSQIE